MDVLHSLTLGDVLRDHARGWPHADAVVCGDTRLTWPQLDDRVTRLADVFADHGVGAGDAVLWLGQNCHRLLEGLLACAKLGAVFCPANWRSSTDEFVHAIEELQPRVVLWQADAIGEVVDDARRRSGSDAVWVGHDDDGDGGYEARLRAADPHDDDAPVDPRSPVLALFTAAFTGRPKAAALTHEAVLQQSLTTALVQEITPESVTLNCGPLFHVMTFMTTWATFHLGGTNVFTARAEPLEVLELIDREGCTTAFLMPQTVQEMGRLNADGRYDLSTLVTMRMGVEGFDEHIADHATPWIRRPGGFGQTEVSGLATLAAWGGPGMAGRSVPGAVVRVVDPDGQEVPVGETGEIVVRGPVVMHGYVGRPDETAARHRDGWHHTRDLGRRTEQGTIEFVAPMTRLIKSAAENIYPAEVEACLVAHPGVFQVVVIGVPDDEWGQRVKALVRRDQTHEPPVDEDELIAWCRERIASYKKPREIEFVDGLPKDADGAIDRDACDERFGGGGYPGTG